MTKFRLSEVKKFRKRFGATALVFVMGVSSTLGTSGSFLDSVFVKAQTTVQEQEVVSEAEQVNADYPLCENSKDGVILHAFCWSFNTIKENMEDIAAAGFTTVQTSPINECLVGEGGGMQLMGNGKWYYHYQPTDWKIGNYQLGTRDEYIAMCDEADKYGVKIISDVLPNHTTPTLSAVSQELINAAGGDLYHANGFNEITQWTDRYHCTTGQMGGLPDVNTENKGFQEYYLKFCNDVIACGGDGFRYDTAKHIGVPSDPKDEKSAENDFWPVASGQKAVNGISLSNPDKLFIYGEVLMDTGIPYEEYGNYINMTNSGYGGKLRSIVGSKSFSAGNLGDWGHPIPDKTVTWVESHDTYCNDGESVWMTNEQIRACWAVITARKQGTPLFMSRPMGSTNTIDGRWGTNQIGAAGNDEYKHPEVVAVNRFRTAMVGESEYLSNFGGEDCLVIERGTKGAVIINMGSQKSNVKLNKVADGTYTEQVSGKEVQVSGGVLSYDVPGGSIAVVYNAGPVVKSPKVTASKSSGDIYEAFTLTLTASNATKATYSVDGGEAVEFTDKATVKIGEGASVGDKITVKVTAEGDGDPFSETLTYTFAEKPAYKMYLRLKKSDFDSVPTIYLYDSADKALNGAWPGTAMETDSDYYVYTSDSLDSATAIIVCGTWRSTADMQPGLSVSGYMEYDKASNKFTTFTPASSSSGSTSKVTPTPDASTPTPKADDPTPTPDANTLSVSASVADGETFTDETMEVTLNVTKATSGTYILDNGPEKTFTNGTKVVVGQGKIADTEITLQVKASDGTNTVNETYTYKKVFDASKAKIVSSATVKIRSLFEVLVEAAEVNAAAETGGLYATNPSGGVGKAGTITIDGSFSDWSEDMLIAQGGAWDIANCWKGGHENCVLDTYSLYAAWDDSNLYIGWQMVNTTDTWAREGEGPLSDGGRVLDVPLIVALNTGKSYPMSGKTTNGTGVWGVDVEFETTVDHLLYMSGKVGLGSPGFFKAADSSGEVDYENPASCSLFKERGVTYDMAEGCLPGSIMALEGSQSVDDAYDAGAYKDMLSAGHNTSFDSFYEIAIPLSELGITKSDIESEGIGAMVVATRGCSAIDCIPHDPSMLDNVDGDCAVDPSTSHEKDDKDIITVPLASVGKAGGGTAVGTGSGSSGSSSSSGSTTTPATATPSTGDGEATATPTPAAGNTSGSTSGSTSTTTGFTVNFGADRSSPQLDTTALTLKAIPQGGTADYTYQFSVDNEVVQEYSTQATYIWNGSVGEHTIKVQVKDASDKEISFEKEYVIEASKATTVTSTPTAGNNSVTNAPQGDSSNQVIATNVPDSNNNNNNNSNNSSNSGNSGNIATSTPDSNNNNNSNNNNSSSNNGNNGITVTTAPGNNNVATQSPNLGGVNSGITTTATPKPNSTGTTTGTSNGSNSASVVTQGAVTNKDGLTLSFNVNKMEPSKAGTPIAISLEASGGTQPYKYTVQIIDGDSQTQNLLNNSSTGKVTWTPSKEGSYKIVIKVTDSNGSKAQSYSYYKVSSPIEIAKFKLSKSKVKAGKKLKLTAKATSDTKVKYQFKIKKSTSSKISMLQKYSTKNTCTVKVKKKGTYTIYLQVKDADGNVKTMKKQLKVVK